MEKYTFEDLCRVLDRLLGEGGCPWDREQTHETMRRGLIEECYEAVDAINIGDNTALCEELGDVIYLCVFHAKLAERAGTFSTADVLDGITRKMISRHPHVFADTEGGTAEEVIDNWENLKAKEKAYSGTLDRLKSVPRSMPSVMRAEKVLKRGADASPQLNDYDRAIAGLTALSAEAAKLKSMDEAQKSKIIGDLILQVTDISRILKINADFALTNSIETYINRFEGVEEL